jgi:hypothetical protein
MKSMRVLPFCLLVLISACEQPPASAPESHAGPGAHQPSATELAVAELLREEQTTRLRRLGASSRVFADAVDGLLGDPSDDRLATAREGWSQLYRSFNEAVVVLVCRASGSAPLAAALQRVDPFPILPGYIDGLSEWPDSGIVNDVSLPLTRDALLGQQGVTAQEEISLGFQVVAFLLYGEPGDPRQVMALTRVTEISADNPLALDEQPENRRRDYLALATTLLVEDLLLLTADTETLPPVGSHCPVDALRRTTERMIRVAGLHDRESVSGEYYSGHSRAIALAGLQQALTPWLAEQSALREWLAEAGMQSALPAPQFSGEPDILVLQQLHAGLSAGRSLVN